MPGSATGLLNDEADNLLATLISHYDPSSGLGHMSPSIYDTAWVSMITKADEWLFPAAFQYLLDHQHQSGGWESSSETDSISNTLSALLSMKLYSYKDATLSDRLQMAQSYLATRLDVWDISAVERVGFEITVPTLLSLLSEQGIDFSFPGRFQLMELNSAKLSALTPQAIYGLRTAILHSLEGLIGHIDFAKLAHHKRNGSFMASPGSTAAYLMYGPVWDDECEAYLREVLSHGGNGSVSCAWPTTFFELSWIVCNLHDGGFNFSDLDQVTVSKISAILKAGTEAGNGIVGFAPDVGEDADDSAKVLTALQYLGVQKPLTPLCDAFELESHFRCYPYERNASITVQCNVLSALVEAAVSQPLQNGTRATGFAEKQISEPIIKTARFISEAWWTTNSQILDKWHDSPYYSMLLIAQSLSKFLLLFNQGHIAEAPEIIVQTKAPIALFQILIRTLQGQKSDGSWGSCEETAYALLTLSNLTSLPFMSIMHDAIQAAVHSGRDFLHLSLTGKQDTGDEICLWIDKVNYRIPPVSYSYVLAALRATASPIPDSPSKFGELDRFILIPTKRVQGFLRFYRKLPLFRDCKDWQLLAYIAEGYLYIPILEEVRMSVFGREGMGEETYMEYIPFSWTSANSRTNNYSCPMNSFVCMTISLINFQVDEFFDSMVRDHGTAAQPTLRRAFDEIFDALDNNQSIADFDRGDGPFSTMLKYMHKYICFIVDYPTLQNASEYDKAHNRRELKAYLLGMTQQTEDNAVYAKQTSWGDRSPPQIILPEVDQDSLRGAHIRFDFLLFIAQDCITHMAVLCRIWNDWGSMKRDVAERNISGMNFPEFAGMTEEQIKAQMRRISDYERRCLHASLADLRQAAKEVMGEAKGNKCVDSFEFFFRGAEVYDAIYEFKDISAWKLSLMN
ncbi:Ent-kaurene synthase [Mycena sanguinolenta]|uniref:Ent-kaurene synthase n=1 Tax=Mycena sanguinolenta TaxID=230812 RepID=A0A8H6ZD67_9AGAR|nr:Ent-kaurene synthase [Mycena sanguinolenta]